MRIWTEIQSQTLLKKDHSAQKKDGQSYKRFGLCD